MYLISLKLKLKINLERKLKLYSHGAEYYDIYDELGEQRSCSFVKYLTYYSIVPQYILLGTPSQNGVA